MKVLVVQDDEADLELMSRGFEDSGDLTVRFAQCLGEARRLLRDEEAPAVVVAGHRLPDGNGTDLVDPRRWALVIMTSEGDRGAAAQAMTAGAIDHMVKSPAMFADMPHIVKRALGEWTLRRDHARLELDLTEKRRLAAIGTASAMLAHEIGNPLNSMSLMLQLLQRRAERDPSQAAFVEGLDAVVGEIRRLDNLLQEFQMLSRRAPPTLRRLDLGALVLAVQDGMSASAQEAGVRVHTRLNGDLVVMAAADQLVQVLLNLGKNAIEAMPEGGDLTVEARRVNDQIVLKVCDTGVGIPPGLDIFEAFCTTKPLGTGLGLPIVRHLLGQQGGTIATTDRDGGGTTFRVELPVAPREGLGC